jgi:N6-L-threonylcarbamoyladenine synthase
MYVLGIETTCDETACAVVKDGKEILSSVVASQADLHAKYGGVFPEVACRRHFEVMVPVVEEALEMAGRPEINLISVAKGPGLIGALLIGINTAKSLSLAWEVPFVGVNHVEAHLYAAMMGREKVVFPALGVVISGGHTFMIKISGFGAYEIIGQTADDAIGEAFDKVAVMLGLSYPGGPQIEALARGGDKSKYSFKPGRVKENPWNFSFSGLKTNVLYTVKGQDGKGSGLISEEEKPHIAAAFQETALGDIVDKATLASKVFGCQEIFLGGGVARNNRLRELFSLKSPVPVHFPVPDLCVDNAAMIAGLGYHVFERQGASGMDLEPMLHFNVDWPNISV